METVAFFNAEQLQQAQALLSRVIREDSKQDNLSYHVGCIALQTGDIQTALERFYYAIHLNPDKALYYQALALAYNACGKIDETIQAYRQAGL